VRTSATNPIKVDFLPQDVSALPGRIGLTLAPGRKDDRWDRDLREDVRRLRRFHDATLLVSLVEDHELKLLGIEDLAWEAHRVGMRFRRLPIADGGVPRRPEEVAALVQVVLAVAQAGDTVVIHCRGGLGRAGVLAACCLVALGQDGSTAVRIVRKARHGAIQTRRQEDFIKDFGETWAASERRRPWP
jgi:protein-tyrosine phosphatase